MRPLTNNQGAPKPLTDDQVTQGLLIYNQGPPGSLTVNREALGLLTDNLGGPGAPDLRPRARARGPLIQCFYNLYAKPIRNLTVLSQRLQPQALV